MGVKPIPPFQVEVGAALILLPRAYFPLRLPLMPCRSVPVRLPCSPSKLMTLYGVPDITSAVLDEDKTLGKLIEAPLPILKTPLLFAADSERLAVFGLIANPAVVPVAVIFAFTLTLFVAVNVRVVSALQLTPSLMFILPEPVCAPDAL